MVGDVSALMQTVIVEHTSESTVISCVYTIHNPNISHKPIKRNGVRPLYTEELRAKKKSDKVERDKRDRR